jgi:tetratricopeptide (TPR) repeat protein
MMIAKTGLMALTLVALASAPASAADSDPRPDPERAQQLHAQAISLLDSPRRWAEAASLLRRSAENLSDDDPTAFTTMRFAGRVYAQAGELGKARKAFTDAAELALARGEVVDAAYAYIDAAHAASEQGATSQVIELAEKARRLTSSPLLPDADRDAIGALVGAL